MHTTIGRLGTSIAAAALLAACATAGTSGPDTSPPPSGTVGRNPTSATEIWPIKTREHVDLWLHGFAMVSTDSTLVPFFKRGYRADMSAIKARSNTVTQLDANYAKLHARLSVNPGLVNAQFLPLYFDSFEEMTTAMNEFFGANGDPRRASSQQMAETLALIAGYFPSTADRDWARLFMQSLSDENTRFYRSYWDQQQRERADVITAVNGIWEGTYRARFQPFLNNTSQAAGEIFLSLPLDGEGRTLSAGKRQNATAVTFPARSSDAQEAIYVFTHEVVASLVSTAVRDNVTPTDQRSGVADSYIAMGAVRAGALLLQKIAPELLNGYARYYLTSANRPVGSNPVASLAVVFPLPDAIRAAISRQLDVVLGGI